MGGFAALTMVMVIFSVKYPQTDISIGRSSTTIPIIPVLSGTF